jgi:hypothetical protein
LSDGTARARGWSAAPTNASRRRYPSLFIPREYTSEKGAISAIVPDVEAVILENDGTLTVAWEAKGPGRSSLVDATVPSGTRVEENENAGGKRAEGK